MRGSTSTSGRVACRASTKVQDKRAEGSTAWARRHATRALWVAGASAQDRGMATYLRACICTDWKIVVLKQHSKALCLLVLMLLCWH
jgi:hypothetical protein